MASKAGPAIGSSQAGQVTVQRGTYDGAITDWEDAAIQIRMVKLPAQHVILDLVLDSEIIDTGAGGAFDIGIEDSIQDPADTTDLTLFATALAVHTAAIFGSQMSLAAMRLAPQNYDRYIVLTMETVSATGLAVRVGLTLTSKPALGDQFDGNFA
jgi:hypothetical protein